MKNNLLKGLFCGGGLFLLFWGFVIEMGSDHLAGAVFMPVGAAFILAGTYSQWKQ